MSHTITKYDATILNHHAKSGDALELGRSLAHLAQRQGPNGIGRADILLLAKDEAGDTVAHAAFLNRPAKSGDVLGFSRTLGHLAQRQGQRTPTAMMGLISSPSQRTLNRHAKSGDVLEFGRTLDNLAQREAPNGYDRADILLLAKE